MQTHPQTLRPVLCLELHAKLRLRQQPQNGITIMRSKLLLLVVAVVVPNGLCAPQLPRETRLTLDNLINGMFDSFDDTITPDHPLEFRASQEGVADLYMQMTDVDITGVGDFASYGSIAEIQSTNINISITIKSPKVTVNAGHYFINGTFVDHIEIFGEGPGMISVDDMAIKLEGYGSIKPLQQSVEFVEAAIDLEMWRWTVNLEDLMPGTDLGTVFNEFFTMCGPEIFDTIENNLNNSDKVVNFLNNIVSSMTSNSPLA